MSFLISDAWAEAAPAAEQGDPLVQVLFFVGIFVLFYFLLIRPQSKRAKEHRNLVAALAKGDEIVTSGGMLGKISELTDDFVKAEIANNVYVNIQRSAITAVLPKGTIKSL